MKQLALLLLFLVPVLLVASGCGSSNRPTAPTFSQGPKDAQKGEKGGPAFK